MISPLASARIQRWALTLSNYQYHLRYKSGVQSTNADGLSRLPLPTKTAYVPVINDTPITATEIAQLTARDPVLNFVLQGWPSVVDEEFAAYSRRKDELSVGQG